jgi:hypothetical protein
MTKPGVKGIADSRFAGYLAFANIYIFSPE